MVFEEWRILWKLRKIGNTSLFLESFSDLVKIEQKQGGRDER